MPAQFSNNDVHNPVHGSMFAVCGPLQILAHLAVVTHAHKSLLHSLGLLHSFGETRRTPESHRGSGMSSHPKTKSFYSSDKMWEVLQLNCTLITWNA